MPFDRLWRSDLEYQIKTTNLLVIKTIVIVRVVAGSSPEMKERYRE